MEPARDERGDAKVFCGSTLGVQAAMEPARDERGDLPGVVDWPNVGVPQWSPLAMSGATYREFADRPEELLPQWSPLAMSGATHRPGPARLGRAGAAMEPARDERGDGGGLATGP